MSAGADLVQISWPLKDTREVTLHLLLSGSRVQQVFDKSRPLNLHNAASSASYSILSTKWFVNEGQPMQLHLIWKSFFLTTSAGCSNRGTNSGVLGGKP